MLHSPLQLNFSLPLLGDIYQGIGKSVFLSILDSVVVVVLVNVSSLGERLSSAAFPRTKWWSDINFWVRLNMDFVKEGQGRMQALPSTRFSGSALQKGVYVERVC